MLVLKEHLSYLTLAQKHKSSDAENSDMPKPPQSVSFKWKGEVLNLRTLTEVVKIYSKNELFIPEIVKEKESQASFAVIRQTTKVIATVCDKGLVKMEMSLNYRFQNCLQF